MAQTVEEKRAAFDVNIAQHKFKRAVKNEEQDAQLAAVTELESSHFLVDVDAFLKRNSRANVQVSDNNILDHESRGAD